MDEGRESQVHDLIHRTEHLAHFFYCRLCKGDTLSAQLLCRLQDIHRMVTDALKIADHVQQLRRLHPILVTQMTAR